MSVRVGRSLDEIDSKVKQLNKSIKESSKQTRELDRTLRIDPRNVQATKQRIQGLGQQIGMATQKVALLRQRMNEANTELQQGSITQAEFDKIAQAVTNAEQELQRFNLQLQIAKRQQVQQLARRFDQVTRSLQQAHRVAQTFSRLLLGLVGIMGAAVTVFSNHANTLREMADEYELCIERLQTKRGVFEAVTGSADNYNRALDRLRHRLNRITLGTGVAYENILARLGIASRDAEGRTRSLAEVYDEVIQALREMEDVNLRNRLAYELFGEEAINIIEILNLTREEYEELKRIQEEQNLVSAEQAETARQLQEQWDNVRKEFMAVGAELATALLPLIKLLAQLIQDFLLPLLTKIANWFANMSPVQQKFMLFLIFLVIFLPKIIMFFKAIVTVTKGITLALKGAAVGAKMLSMGAAPLIPILLAVVAVVTILAFLFAFLTGRSRELRRDLDQQRGSMDSLGASYQQMGNGLEHQIETVSRNSNTQNNNISVTIDAQGDTPISQENAQAVADLLADRINRELGGKI